MGFKPEKPPAGRDGRRAGHGRPSGPVHLAASGFACPAYWRHGGATNAAQEGFNNTIRWLIRQAYGFRDC
jgi:hypothetical protein